MTNKKVVEEAIRKINSMIEHLEKTNKKGGKMKGGSSVDPKVFEETMMRLMRNNSVFHDAFGVSAEEMRSRLYMADRFVPVARRATFLPPFDYILFSEASETNGSKNKLIDIIKKASSASDFINKIKTSKIDWSGIRLIDLKTMVKKGVSDISTKGLFLSGRLSTLATELERIKGVPKIDVITTIFKSGGEIKNTQDDNFFNKMSEYLDTMKIKKGAERDIIISPETLIEKQLITTSDDGSQIVGVPYEFIDNVFIDASSPEVETVSPPEQYNTRVSREIETKTRKEAEAKARDEAKAREEEEIQRLREEQRQKQIAESQAKALAEAEAKKALEPVKVKQQLTPEQIAEQQEKAKRKADKKAQRAQEAEFERLRGEYKDDKEHLESFIEILDDDLRIQLNWFKGRANEEFKRKNKLEQLQIMNQTENDITAVKYISNLLFSWGIVLNYPKGYMYFRNEPFYSMWKRIGKILIEEFGMDTDGRGLGSELTDYDIHPELYKDYIEEYTNKLMTFNCPSKLKEFQKYPTDFLTRINDVEKPNLPEKKIKSLRVEYVSKYARLISLSSIKYHRIWRGDPELKACNPSGKNTKRMGIKKIEDDALTVLGESLSELPQSEYEHNLSLFEEVLLNPNPVV
jgi:hypothetical protein